jgi:small multidrug resistance family-3 protein
VTARSIALFIAAALAEISGAYLVWIGLREHKGALVVVLGMVALALYGVVATFQPSHEFGRVLAAYGGVFIIGSLLWGVAFDGFHPRPLRHDRRRHLPDRRRDDHVRPLAAIRRSNRRQGPERPSASATRASPPSRKRASG